MNQYAIMRRNGWQTRAELDDAGERSNVAREIEMAGQLHWIRSYFFREEDGTLGTICIYEAESPEAIREHAARANLPANEILQIVDSVVNRPDPQVAAV